MKVHGASKKKIYILKQCNFIACQDTKNKDKIKYDSIKL